jgi:hypothetical protein
MSHFNYCCTECQYGECHYAECQYAECHHAECHYAECHYAECNCAECHYAECYHGECHDSNHGNWQIISILAVDGGGHARGVPDNNCFNMIILFNIWGGNSLHKKRVLVQIKLNLLLKIIL